jgi:hypothetical protein
VNYDCIIRMTKSQRLFKFATTFFLVALLAHAATAQEEYFKIEEPEKKTGVRRAASDSKVEEKGLEETKFLDKLRLGGSAGLRFGTFTNLNLSPMVGLALSEKFTVGVGPTYIFVKDSYFVPSSSASFYGGRAMARFNFVPMVHLQAEYEMMNVEFYNHGYGKYQNINKTYARTWLKSPMLGIGYTQPVGGRFVKGIHATLLYNFDYTNHINPSINYGYYHPGTQVKNISHYASPIVFKVSIL